MDATKTNYDLMIYAGSNPGLHKQARNKLRPETCDDDFCSALIPATFRDPLLGANSLGCIPPINTNAADKVHLEVRSESKVRLKSIFTIALDKLIEKSKGFRGWSDVSEPVVLVV